MHVLVVQNYDGTGLGQIGTALDEAGAVVDLRRTYIGDPLPEPGEHDAMVVLGGAQNARDDANHPYLPALVALMRSTVEADRPVLGVCLGAQLLARAFDADNLIGKAPEFGWQAVQLTADGQADPLFSGVPQDFPIFQWHDDTFTLPSGAVRLAANAAVANQAFRVGRAGYGTQFHFEADRNLIEVWNRDFAEVIARKQPDWHMRYPSEATAKGSIADDAGLAIARNWVSLIPSR